MALAASALLQGAALDALQAFFQAAASSGAAQASYQSLSQVLFRLRVLGAHRLVDP
jgi:hypothetical protein